MSYDQRDIGLFAYHLRQNKDASGQTWNEVAAACQVSNSHLKRIAYARGVASMQQAIKLSEYFKDPLLVDIMARMRTKRCERCGVVFVTTKHHAKRRYCSGECQNWDERERNRELTMRGLSTELDLTRYRLRDANHAIAAFCHECETDNICKTPSCRLRPVSPLPLLTVARKEAS